MNYTMMARVNYHCFSMVPENMRDFKLYILMVKKSLRQLIRVPESTKTTEFFDALTM